MSPIEQWMRALLSARERHLGSLAAAFVEETGYSPQEIELVEERHGTTTIFSFRHREGAERRMEPEVTVNPHGFWLALFAMRDALAEPETRREIEFELRLAPRAREMVRDLEAILEELLVDIPEQPS